MREMSVAVAVDRPDLRSVPDLAKDRCAVNPEHVAFARRVQGELIDVTIGEFVDEVRAVAKGLIAARVEPGDRIAIMSPTRYEWSVADFAIWEAGAVVVPIYDTASATQAGQILRDCDVKIAVAGGAAHRDLLRAAMPGLHVWTFDEDPRRDLAALLELGASSEITDSEVSRRGQIAGPDDLATIVFTSGTTGVQKGVRITHGNLVRLVVQVAAQYEEVVHEGAVTVILLPLAHVLAQGLQVVSVFAGMKVVHEADPRSAVAAMAEIRPTFMVVVPRILEKVLAAARRRARERRLGRVFAMAERTAVAWGAHLERVQDEPGARPSRRLAIRHALFDRLFYGRLRALLGGRVDYLLSGASPLHPDLANFFRGAGIPVIEGYGLTETTAPVTGNTPGRMKAGSVGTPIPGSDVRISDVGEVLVRGVGVSPGFLRPEDDDGAYVDGFYRTGDVGRLDEQGFLYIDGRLKNIIVTASGKNVAPEPWEKAVATDPLIAEAVMVGEGRPYVTALIVLDGEETVAWARHRGPTGLAEAVRTSDRAGLRVADAQLRSRIQRTIDSANSAVSRAEQVRRFTALIADLSEEELTLTPTLKLRRDEFLESVAHHVDALYREKDES